MKCFAPLRLKVRGATNLSGAPVFVPCGRCFACKQNNRNSWSFRLHNEASSCLNSFFFTLTYNPKYVPKIKICNSIFKTVSKRDVQLFIKRLRKNSGLKFTYYIISEYGPRTNRPHYHGIIFLYSKIDKDNLQKFISSSWFLGFCRVDSLSLARIEYVTAYTFKECEPRFKKYQLPNFRLTSRRPALGSSFLEDYNNFDLIKAIENGLTNIKYNDKFINIPRYYKNKIAPTSNSYEDLENIYNTLSFQNDYNIKKFYKYYKIKYPNWDNKQILSYIFHNSNLTHNQLRFTIKQIFKNGKVQNLYD
ncbi:replication initiator protein [Capybara microvirus Cap3_SP_475]|nr:replication initiator protein [Capybara microvirus Cap3_SP_475]